MKRQLEYTKQKRVIVVVPLSVNGMFLFWYLMDS